MTFKNKICLFIFCIHLSASCSDRESTQSTETNLSELNLVSGNSISIPIDSLTSVQKYLQLVSLSGEEYLISYQSNQSESSTNFHFYLLKDREKVFTLTFDEIGPNGVGKISPFASFVNFDSILVSQINSNKVYLMDSAGNLKTKYDFNGIKSSKGTIYPMATYPLAITNENLYSFQMNSFDSETGKFSKGAYPEVIYNLKTNQWSSGIVTYPEYPDLYYNSIEVWKVSRCFGLMNELVYSFAFDNNLYVSNNYTVRSFSIRNDDFRILNASPPDIRLDDMRSQMKLISESGLYLSLIPDPYRNIYYRIYLMPGDFMDVDGKFYMLAERPFKIQVINDNFKLIGETEFDGRKFNPYRIMVCKDGLLIEEGNPYNPISDDRFIFKLFNIVANDD